jgi:hypothetical protein
MSASGPDIPAIYCHQPEGCCGADVCGVTEEEFVCAIRALLPEGEVWNNTRKYRPSYEHSAASMIGCSNIECGQLIDGGPAANRGTTMVGCAMVGCEQLVWGGCCDDEIPCEDEPPQAPQLAVVDAFAATAYGVLRALCDMLRELDPCTARQTIKRWAARMGIVYPDPCAPGWSDEMLTILICLFPRLRFEVWNQEALQRLAAFFGVCIKLYEPGKFNCDYGPAQGWAGWTLARDRPACPPPQAGPLIRMVSTCYKPPSAINIVLCQPACINLPPNCNLPVRPSVWPRPNELLEAFKYVLGLVLPGNVPVCLYDCDGGQCIQ